jgi:hypothetical protein
VIAAAFDEAEARDPGHLRTWVVLVDGAEHQVALIRAEAARRGVTIHIIVDIIHVLKYLWGAAWSLHEAGDPAAEDWVAARALAVLAGDSDRAAEEITAEAAAAGLAASRRTGGAACVQYLEGKREFLHYDQALEAGWPIATGVIEGACRHLIADRLRPVLHVDHSPLSGRGFIFIRRHRYRIHPPTTLTKRCDYTVPLRADRFPGAPVRTPSS